MYEEGYVKIPLARYEELRESENELEKPERSIRVSDFVEEVVIGEERIESFFSFTTRETVNLEINTDRLLKEINDSYGIGGFKEKNKIVNMITIKEIE